MRAEFEKLACTHIREIIPFSLAVKSNVTCGIRAKGQLHTPISGYRILDGNFLFGFSRKPLRVLRVIVHSRCDNWYHSCPCGITTAEATLKSVTERRGWGGGERAMH